MTQPLITIQDVCLSYGERHVLCHISQQLGPRDFVVLTGPNGGGKTTLLRLIAGLLKPTCGAVIRTGRVVTGYLPQYRHIDRQFPTTVYDIVLSGMQSRKRLFSPFTSEQRSQALDTLRRFHLDGMAHTPIAELSGGQWQRTLLARAMAARPDLLLLDEPETHLDEASRTELYDILQGLSGQCATVVVSHDEHTFPTFPTRRIWHVEDKTVTERDSW